MQSKCGIYERGTFSLRYRKIAASSLMITNVRESDHGSYQCRAENEVESLDAVAELIVQGTIFAVHVLSYYLLILKYVMF